MILKFWLNDYTFFRNINYRHQGTLKLFRTSARPPSEPKYEPNASGLSGFVAREEQHKASTKKKLREKIMQPFRKRKF